MVPGSANERKNRKIMQNAVSNNPADFDDDQHSPYLKSDKEDRRGSG
jgi:hypothetical protein